MNETNLQEQIVKAFRDKYPQKRRHLIAIKNESYSKKKGSKANMISAIKANNKGIVPGCTDMLFVSENYNLWIEVKVKGTRHSREHLERQLYFMRDKENLSAKNKAFFVFSVEDFFNAIEYHKGMTADDFENIYLSNRKKTITL